MNIRRWGKTSGLRGSIHVALVRRGTDTESAEMGRAYGSFAHAFGLSVIFLFSKNASHVHFSKHIKIKDLNSVQ